MKLLLVAATLHETVYLREKWGIKDAVIGLADSAQVGNLHIEVLHTGIGMVNTAYHLGRYLINSSPDFALQIGIAGAFAGGPQLGSVVEVLEECYADLGAESSHGILDLEELGFENFRAAGKLFWNKIDNPSGEQSLFPTCRGITVNRVHGRTDSIAEMVLHWWPEVESMEGAAFFQCCLMNEIPFLQLRGISNVVEERNRDAWRIGEAVAAVQHACLGWLEGCDLEVDG